MADSILIIGIILFVLGVLFISFVLRSVFRINTVVKNQEKTVQLLIKLVELKKKEMGIQSKE